MNDERIEVKERIDGELWEWLRVMLWDFPFSFCRGRK